MSLGWLLALIVASVPSEAALLKAQALLDSTEYEAVGPAVSALLADATAPSEARAQAEILLGLARHNLLDDQGAQAAFRRGLSLEPKVELPPGSSPRAQELFRNVQVDLQARQLEAPPPLPTISAPERPAWIPIATAGAGLGLAGAGAFLLSEGLAGRSQALGEPEALAAQDRFEGAQTQYRWGSGLLIASGVVSAAAVALFFWAFSTPEPVAP